jgi:SAM-dependent methyltransferase
MDNQTAMRLDSLKSELELEYDLRFSPLKEYRSRIWKLLVSRFFQRYVPEGAHVLDVGCGWGEFINNIRAAKRYGIDLNPDGASKLDPQVIFLNQDCSAAWGVADGSLDVVFTSNFFEHLPTKDHLRRTLLEAKRCLKRGGSIICLGPNVKYLPGEYWDFWDHYLPLTERSLAEVLELTGFEIQRCAPRFLPYTMVYRRHPALFLVGLYLRMAWALRFFGNQFLVFGIK